jgi:hypothetical protein
MRTQEPGDLGDDKNHGRQYQHNTSSQYRPDCPLSVGEEGGLEYRDGQFLLATEDKE